MPEVEEKHLRNRLSRRELDDLRKELNAASDADIAVRMSDSWNSDEFEFSQLSQERVMNMKRNIDVQTRRKIKSNVLNMYLRIAVAILLPVLFLSTVYLYNKSETLAEQNIEVCTLRNEKANVTLPDGTRVFLNSESRLAYSPKDYNGNRRYVTFEGEAYFDVASKAGSPFLVAFEDVRIEVLGTRFNLLARNSYSSVELFLEEGKVRISSSNDSEVLTPNQKAVLNKSTGKIQVLTLTKEAAPAWRSGELRFSNTTFSEVMRTIEMNFGVSIDYGAIQSLKQDQFSGVLSSKHLIESLDVIAQCYRLNYVIVGDAVTFNK